MIPVSLRISGFLSYREPVTIDFTTFDLAAISGSNGAGKSSLLDAITWALFGEARRRDDALINSACDAAEVIFDFDYEAQRYRVQRSKFRNKTAVLEFFIQHGDREWRPLTEHSLRQTSERIEHTLRMDYETFTNASFLLQGKADQFAQQRPGDRKRILSSILGLEVWEAYREEAALRRKGQENQLTSLEGRLREIEVELQQEKTRRENLSKLQSELDQATALRQAQEKALENIQRLADLLKEQRRLVDMLKERTEAARTRLNQHNQQLEARTQEQKQYQSNLAAADEIEAAYAAWQENIKELERWEGIAVHFRHYEQERSTHLLVIETQRSRLQQELKGCQEQQDLAQQQQSQLPQLEDQLQAVAAEVEGLQARLDQKAQLEEDLRTVIKNQADAAAENGQLKAQMNEIKERLDRLKQDVGAECPLCGQPINHEERQRLIQSLESQGKLLGDKHRANVAFIKESEQRHKTLEQEINQLKLVENDLRQRQQRQSKLSAQIEQIEELLQQWETGTGQRIDVLRNLLERDDYAIEARQELARIDAALKELGYDAAMHDQVRQAEREGRASEERLRSLEKARAALEPLEREITSIRQRIAEDEAEIKTQQEAYLKAEEQYNYDAAGMPSLEEAEQQLFNLREQENRLHMQVGGAKQQVEVLKNLRVRQSELNNQRSDINRQVAQLKTLERAFSKDGIPALLIEQALPEIEAQANSILERLSGGSMMVRFDTQRDYKDKNREDRRETLDILISDGAGPREYELFSGGEAFRVNFAIRLALSRVLAQRAGARLQTLVIDEGFGSQDVEGRQRLLEAISLVRPDFAKVLVITHLEELKDAFPARIEVNKTPNGSQARVVVQ